jgi:branched-subunit amino acid transport protein
LNRNIITVADVPDTVRSGTAGVAPSSASTVDDYFSRLLKYVPLEIIGAYLAVQGLIRTAYAGRASLHWWLLALLVAGVIASWFFAASVIHIVRRQQLAMTSLSFAVWAFATGGWFATNGWYSAWMSTAAVVVFGVLVRILRLPPLPPDAAAGLSR